MKKKSAEVIVGAFKRLMVSCVVPMAEFTYQ